MAKFIMYWAIFEAIVGVAGVGGCKIWGLGL